MISGQSYREFLKTRDGRGISETEVQRLLEQILPALITLHQQGQSHGNISLDTLFRQGTESILSSGMAESYSRPIDDIYQLGTTLLTLLTARSPNSLQQSDGSWNWQDDCLVSDQFSVLIDQMIALENQRFGDAMAMQTAMQSPLPYIPPTIVSSVPNTAVVAPSGNYSPAPAAPFASPHNQQAFSNAPARRPPWFWAVVGGGVTMVLGLIGLGVLRTTSNSNNIPIESSAIPSSSTTNSTNSPIPEPTPVSTPNLFDRESFPKSSCGDSLPTNLAAYPVNFYPIFVPVSDSNLQLARSQFCQDSLAVTRSDTGRKAIQISSFNDRDKAIQFRDYVERSIGDAEVGPPTVVVKPR